MTNGEFWQEIRYRHTKFKRNVSSRMYIGRMYLKLFRSLIASTAALLLFSSPALADADKIVSFNLTLAGYSIGMSFDDASAIRPMQYSQDVSARFDTSAAKYFNALIDHVYVDDIEMNLLLWFKNDRLSKVIARFSPERTEEVAQLFHQALGAGEDKTRTLLDARGQEIRQTIYLWDYPTARIHLVKTSVNDNYATVALVAKSDAMDMFAEED